jgi:hypothetical protein
VFANTVRSTAELAGVPISVGYQSGSHYSTIQALEQYMPADRIALSFAEGMMFRRMEALLRGAHPGCHGSRNRGTAAMDPAGPGLVERWRPHRSKV